MQKLDYPLIVVHTDTLSIQLDKLHLWEHWGPRITKHYLDSPILQYDEIDRLDFLRRNKN